MTFEKKKKSPWRAKLGPFLKKWEIPLAGQTRADGQRHKTRKKRKSNKKKKN